MIKHAHNRIKKTFFFFVVVGVFFLSMTQSHAETMDLGSICQIEYKLSNSASYYNFFEVFLLRESGKEFWILINPSTNQNNKLGYDYKVVAYDTTVDSWGGAFASKFKNLATTENDLKEDNPKAFAELKELNSKSCSANKKLFTYTLYKDCSFNVLILPTYFKSKPSCYSAVGTRKQGLSNDIRLKIWKSIKANDPPLQVCYQG